MAQAFAVRQFRFWLTNYRRTWQGSIYSGVLNPVLYLGAMGLGLGKLVDLHGTATIGGVSYLAFLAPGLLAAAAMQTALDRLCREASEAIANGYTIIVLSDRGIDAGHAALPILLASAGVHHHLVRKGTRTRAGRA